MGFALFLLFLLFVGVPAALFVMLRGQAVRIARLEAEVARLRDAGSADASVREALAAVRVAAPPRAEPAPVAATVVERPVEVANEPVTVEAVDMPAFEPPAAAEPWGARFERLVGGRLLVWVGGVAIALAGLFLVRYSIELGLIGPRTRMIAAAIFGAGLLGGGEWARRRVADDPRIGQALTGAGVLVLYAAAYGSHILYGLIGLGTAFVLMAGIATAALVLSLRQGTPTAVLGLVGGFLVPLLVGRDTGEATPLLGYLTGLNIAVFAVAVLSRRHWLAWGARWMTLGWTTSLLFTADEHVLVTGAFLLVYAVASGLALGEDDEPAPWIVPTLVLLQMGFVVPVAEFSGTAWALFLGLAAAGFALADRNRGLGRLPASAMLGALLLLFTQSAGTWRHPVETSVAVAVLFAAGAWWRLGRADAGGAGRIWTWAWIFCAAAAGPALILRFWNDDPLAAKQAALLARPVWGLVLGALAAAPVALAWRLRARARADAPFDRSLLLSGATAVLLAGVAAFDLVPEIMLPIAWTGVALATLAGARRLDDGGVVRLALVAAAGAAVATAAQVPGLWAALAETLVGTPVLASSLPSPADAALLFAGPAAIGFAMWRMMPTHEAGLARAIGTGAAVLAGLTAYVWYKQLFGLRSEADFVDRGFAERLVLTQGLFLGGCLLVRQARYAWSGRVSAALTALAAARFAWFDLVTLNPAAVAQNVGGLPVADLIVPAYLGSAYWLLRARASAQGTAASVYFALFLAALIAGAGLLVRQAFHGAVLTSGAVGRGELYGYSVAGLALSVGLLLYAGRRDDTQLRIAGLALLTATIAKVFLVDAAELQGVLRILSFLGLGIALIGMGKLYGTLLRRPTVVRRT